VEPEPTETGLDIVTPGFQWKKPTFIANPDPKIKPLRLSTSSDALWNIKHSHKEGIRYTLQFNGLALYEATLYPGQKVIFDGKHEEFTYQITRLRGRYTMYGEVEIIAFNKNGEFHTINDILYPLTIQVPIVKMSSALLATLKTTPPRTSQRIPLPQAPPAPSTLDSLRVWIGHITRGCF